MTNGHALAMTLRRAYLTLHRRADEALQPLDLTADQFALLTELSSTNGLIQRELVDRLASDANTVAAIVRRLDHKGWIERTTSMDDARAKHVWLTATGRRVQTSAAQRVRPIWKQLARFDADLSAPLIKLCRALAPGTTPLGAP